MSTIEEIGILVEYRNILKRSMIRKIVLMEPGALESQGDHNGTEYHFVLEASQQELNFTILVWDHYASYHMLALQKMCPGALKGYALQKQLRLDLIVLLDIVLDVDDN